MAAEEPTPQKDASQTPPAEGSAAPAGEADALTQAELDAAMAAANVGAAQGATERTSDAPSEVAITDATSGHAPQTVAQVEPKYEMPLPPPPQGSRSLNLPDFSDSDLPPEAQNIHLLSDVELNVKIELGRAQMLIEDVLKLGEGSVVELNKLAGDPVDVMVNDRLVARGEVLVLNDNFCVRINEIVADPAHAEMAAG